MLNYTTTTFINSDNFLYCDGRYIKNGSGEEKKDFGSNANKPKYLQVKFGPKIVNDGIVHKACLVGKESYRAATNATATIPFTNVSTNGTIYRICIYVRERNNNSPIFSNTWVFGGKPIYIEYTGSGTASNDIDTVISLIKNYMLFTYGSEVITASKNSSNLVLRAKDQWTIFMNQDGETEVKVESWNTTTNEWTQAITSIGNGAAITVNNGNEAFGDFAHIMKDLRLPTRENTNWFGTTVAAGENDDVPEPSGHYTQYTIQLTSERGVLQQSAVGGVGVSRTVHVFYVKEGVTLVEDDDSTANTDETVTLISGFEAALNAAGIADSTRVTNVTINHAASPVTSPATIDDSTIADTRGTGTTATV